MGGRKVSRQTNGGVLSNAMTQLGLAITFLTTAILVIGFFHHRQRRLAFRMVWWETRHVVKDELPPKQCARKYEILQEKWWAGDPSQWDSTGKRTLGDPSRVG